MNIPRGGQIVQLRSRRTLSGSAAERRPISVLRRRRRRRIRRCLNDIASLGRLRPTACPQRVSN